MNIIQIQEQHEIKHQWLKTHYKLTNEELEAIIDEWPLEWKVPVGIEELSDMEDGLPLDIPIK